MMLIEADKRGPRFGIRLAHRTDDSDRFHLPENLYLIGTMNTADRSLALVDYALRRRFAFITLEPNFSQRFEADLIARRCPPILVEKICGRVKTLNAEIVKDTRSLGAGYQIGHSYFCSAEEITDFEGWYRDIVSAEIEPLLLEYWMDDPKRAHAEISKLLAN
jgi:5-methylcytosine-specific restriction protein B